MEESGGQPDYLDRKEFGGPAYVDFSQESPEGRRSLCYDQEAREGRKKNAPASSAMESCKEMGVSLLTEAQYFALQEMEALDRKTSSWIQAPEEIRALGGGLFCDRRYGRVFCFHNGAESYYASRGFRAMLPL